MEETTCLKPSIRLASKSEKGRWPARIEFEDGHHLFPDGSQAAMDETHRHQRGTIRGITQLLGGG
jgi:hypothetical protein